MELNSQITSKYLVDILNGDAVLFLGAGASTLAKNSLGESLPLGSQLSALICEDMGEGSEYDRPLDKVSSYYSKIKGESTLVALLKKHLDVVSIDDALTTIAKQEWLRIWTTNYDNSIELAHEKAGKMYSSCSRLTFNSNDKSQNQIIHINGKLSGATLNLPKDLVLTTRDYATKVFNESPLSRLFSSDLNLAKTFVFVGYSLADLDVLRYISSIERLKNKVVFIDREDIDPINASDLEDYGQVNAIGIANFSKLLEKKAHGWRKPQKVEAYRNFERVILKESASANSSNLDDFLNLLLLGDVNDQYLGRKAEDGKYTIKRDIEDKCASLIGSGGNTILIHGEFGTGKSVVARRIAIQAAFSGIDTFWRIGFRENAKDEIVKLCNRTTPFVLFIDTYQKDKELILAFYEHAHPECTLVLTERTDTFQVTSDFIYETGDKWGAISEFSVDRLSNDELNQLIELYNKRSIWKKRASQESYQKLKYLREECNSRFSSILLDTLKSPFIKEKLDKITEVFTKSDFYKDVFVIICVFTCVKNNSQMKFERNNYIGEGDSKDYALNEMAINENLLELCFGVDNSDYQRLVRDKSVKNIIDFESNEIKFRSPIVAKFILNNKSSASEVTEVISEVIFNLQEMIQHDSDIMWLCEGLVNFGNIEKLLPRAGRSEALTNFYEQVSTIDYFAEHPLFWLQSAIARRSIGESEKAMYFLETALSYGESYYKKKGQTRKWNPFQIKTTYANHLLSDAIILDSASDALAHVIEAFDLIKDQCIGNTHHRHPYTKTSHIVDVVSVHCNKWDDRQKSIVLSRVKFMKRQTETLSENIRKHHYIQNTVKKYLKAIELLE
ncbi:hypothetical protein AMBAS45_15825 [Alteromonas macleodii str. 'Balearic Sea AD45']|nr:hypothetical protein AMBAS45_15825 [Alteromonas macleodii str. 'Balearic Sea AD45']